MMWRPTRRLRTEASPRCGTTLGGQSNRKRSFFKNTPMTQTALANQTSGAVASFCIFLLTTNALLRKRHPSKWGYALAATRDEAMELCTATSEMPFKLVHEKHPDMKCKRRLKVTGRSA